MADGWKVHRRTSNYYECMISLNECGVVGMWDRMYNQHVDVW